MNERMKQEFRIAFENWENSLQNFSDQNVKYQSMYDNLEYTKRVRLNNVLYFLKYGMKENNNKYFIYQCQLDS